MFFSGLEEPLIFVVDMLRFCSQGINIVHSGLSIINCMPLGKQVDFS